MHSNKTSWNPHKSSDNKSSLRPILNFPIIFPFSVHKRCKKLFFSIIEIAFIAFMFHSSILLLFLLVPFSVYFLNAMWAEREKLFLCLKYASIFTMPKKKKSCELFFLLCSRAHKKKEREYCTDKCSRHITHSKEGRKNLYLHLFCVWEKREHPLKFVAHSVAI